MRVNNALLLMSSSSLACGGRMEGGDVSERKRKEKVWVALFWLKKKIWTTRQILARQA